ncbi:MAG: hypothetical protein K2X03_07110 [Bryobacteraceae bacterium]|nr:hypothetical protein [Bryobacteraceae bacterium]
MTEARDQGWDGLRNGELLDAAEKAGFEVFVTPDQNIRYQQNLEGRKIAIVVLSVGRWTLVRPHLLQIAEALNAVTPGSYVEIDIPLPPRKPFTRS